MLLNRISLLCLLFNFTIFAAFNTASDYFNAASQTYIIDNNIKSAKKYIADGLTAFPNDEKLKKLDSYIKEEEKKQDQNQQNKDQQNKDQNQQDKKDQEKKDDQNKDQQNEQQQKEQQQQAQQNDSKQDMKKEEAKRLLELYADDADSLNKPQKKAHGSKGKFQKDW
jgi:Ca-activated chloride channel family protein